MMETHTDTQECSDTHTRTVRNTERNTLTRAHIPVHAHRQRNKYTERTTDTHIMCTHFNDDICVVAQEKTHMTKTNTQI